MFDITILDLDPKKHRQIRYKRISKHHSTHWYVNTRNTHEDGYILLTDPEKIALLNKLLNYTGINEIGIAVGDYWYDYRVHFFGVGEFRFWDDTGELYSKWGAMEDTHDLNYNSPRPKLRALYSNYACHHEHNAELTANECHPPE